MIIQYEQTIWEYICDPRPRGSWKLQAIYAGSPDNKQTVQITDNGVYVQFDVCEPIMLSPFIFGSGSCKQRLYGIQTMNFQMTWLRLLTVRGALQFSPVLGVKYVPRMFRLRDLVTQYYTFNT